MFKTVSNLRDNEFGFWCNLDFEHSINARNFFKFGSDMISDPYCQFETHLEGTVNVRNRKVRISDVSIIVRLSNSLDFGAV